MDIGAVFIAGVFIILFFILWIKLKIDIRILKNRVKKVEIIEEEIEDLKK